MAGSAAYEAAGVNLRAGNETSDKFFETSVSTWPNREGQFGEPEMFSNGFSGTRAVSFNKLFELHDAYPGEEFLQYHCSDGTGNKKKVPQRVGKHDTIGEDLIAMVSDDAVALGAEGLSLTSILIVNSLGKTSDSPEKLARLERYIAELNTGYGNGANKAGLVIENGEVAEHGEEVDGYGEFRYDWTASLGWLALRSRLLDGSKIKAGDSVVALQEKGFRCNGFSLALNVVEQAFGHEWHLQPFSDETTWGDELLRPSQIYAGIITRLTGGYRPDINPLADIHGVAHITGGGIPEKLGRKLKGLGLGAQLDSLFEPSPAMLEIQRRAKIDDEEMLNVFNGGQGMLVITPEPEKVIEEAGVAGVCGAIAGAITNSTDIEVLSQGLDKGRRLIFPVEN